MKILFALFGFLATASFTSASVSTSAHGDDLMGYACPSSSGNGAIQLIVSKSSTASIGVTLVDASGVEIAQGSLTCTGPMQSAYSCQGTLKLLGLGSAEQYVPVTIGASETLFQGYGGSVYSNSQDVYYCHSLQK